MFKIQEYLKKYQFIEKLSISNANRCCLYPSHATDNNDNRARARSVLRAYNGRVYYLKKICRLFVGWSDTPPVRLYTVVQLLRYY